MISIWRYPSDTIYFQVLNSKISHHGLHYPLWGSSSTWALGRCGRGSDYCYQIEGPVFLPNSLIFLLNGLLSTHMKVLPMFEIIDVMLSVHNCSFQIFFLHQTCIYFTIRKEKKKEQWEIKQQLNRGKKRGKIVVATCFGPPMLISSMCRGFHCRHIDHT